MADGAAGEVAVLDDKTCAALVPERDPRGHKGSHGTLLVLAGSLDYAGAAFLVARAAYRTGVGVVRLAVPASLQPIFAGRVMEATTLGLPETDLEGEVEPAEALDRLLDVDHDALVLGPGLRPGLATVELVEALLVHEGERPPPAVVDAEALASLASIPEWWEQVRRPCVLTPHPGEFRRLRGSESEAVASDEERTEAARAAAALWGQILVLKGAATLIADPEGNVARAPFENPAMGTAGTGDVLAGVIGSLLAQGLPPWDAARLGVYLHGMAGEQLRDRLGDAGLMASDLPEEVTRARRRLGATRPRPAARPLGFTIGERRS
jgi:ADP-dependent NAD(P)H-hydrate dehydratase / NAD(P)H-hydrate epimerase